MEQPTKKLRKRSKSTSQRETPEVKSPELDLNGAAKAKAKEAEDVMSPQGAEAEVEMKRNSPPLQPQEEETTLTPSKQQRQGRKRKASEMKAEVAPAEEEKKAEEENVEKDETKVDNEEVKGDQEEVKGGKEEAKGEKEEKQDEKPVKEDEKQDQKQANEAQASVDLSSSPDSKDIKLPPKQTLGKGKRARIPNKRYSDIMLSPRQNHAADVEKNKKQAVENGIVQDSAHDAKEKENVDTEGGGPEGKVDSPVITGVKRSNRASPTGHTVKKSKISVDLSNPNYLKPFQYGWKRELVYRATSDNSSFRRNGDIYYYTPSGKKVRSMREVSENLKNKELTLDDFTFCKEPLGLDPDKEIIREAKLKSTVGNTSAASGAAVPTPKKVTPRTKAAKAAAPSSPKASASPVTTSPEATPAATTTAETPATITPVEGTSKGKKGAAKNVSGYKIKLMGLKGKQNKQDKSTNDEEMEAGAYPPNWQQTKKTTKWNSSYSSETSSKPRRPCSIRCPGVVGLIPTLQCRVCLCLYHNECVGVASNVQTQAYICKNCQLEQEASTPTPLLQPPPPPPLTPVSSLKASQPPVAGVLPKLQRITRADGDEGDAIATQQLQQPLPQPTRTSPPPPSPAPEPKGLVGGVTTWFPPSSTIRVGGDQLRQPRFGSGNVPRPQFVEILGDRKYLIIPKHNVLSVSPSVATTSAVVGGGSRSEENVASGDGVAQKEPPDSASLGPSGQEERGDTVGDQTDSAKGKRTSARTAAAAAAAAASSKPEHSQCSDNFLQQIAFGYNTLLYVFQYLKVQDLLRAGCVCHMWHDVASHPSLWKTVRMKNSQVHSFDGLAETLRKHNTAHLDLRKMLLPNGGDEIWPSFSHAIEKVKSLRKIELCRCPASVVEQLPVTNPELEVVNAVTIRCESMTLAPFAALKHLQELRLKSTAGLTLTSDLSALKELTELKHLSLTSIKDLNKQNIEVIADLKNLESLDLGECTDFPKSFGEDILTKLEKLEKLRMEKGQGNCYTFEILQAVKNMPHLEQLELVNFDIKNGFDLALGACLNIKKLLIIPTYISQSATTNHMVLGGVLRLRSTLSHFVWGVTLELLRVTELFVDQCEEPEKKEKKEKKATSSGDSIPVLKPVPLIKDNDTVILPAHDPPQVEILPLQNLQKLLLQSLPTTRVKILKIPFHATWRQSITDTVN